MIELSCLLTTAIKVAVVSVGHDLLEKGEVEAVDVIGQEDGGGAAAVEGLSEG